MSVTEKIYLTDAYKKEVDAKVTAVNSKTIELDRTVFYPTGGGQPNDIGTISLNGKSFQIIDVKKEGDTVKHISDAEPELHVGDSVSCKIDWERRYTYMRHHTAIHVVGGLMEKKYKAMFTGGMIGLERSHFDFDMPQLNRELAEQIVSESQDIIDRKLNVLVRILPKEDALRIPSLVRTLPGQELLKKLDKVRVVEIEGFDVQMDGGTHVKNTSEIGRIRLSDFENKGSHRKRIELSLET